MIKNRNLATDARTHVSIGGEIDVSSDTAQRSVLILDQWRDVKIIRLELLSTVDGDTETIPNFLCGTFADDNLYADFSPSEVAASNAAGTVQNVTLLSTALLPAGTAMTAERYTSEASTNTNKFIPVLYYQYVDRAQS